MLFGFSNSRFKPLLLSGGITVRYAFYQWLKTHAEQGEGIDLRTLSAEEEAMLWKEIGRTSEYLVEAMESYLTREGDDWEWTKRNGSEVSDRWYLSPKMVSQLTGQYKEGFEEEWHKIREKQKQGLYGQEYEAKEDIGWNKDIIINGFLYLITKIT